MIRETERQTASGLLMLAVFLILMGVAVAGLVRAARADDVLVAVLCVFVIVASILGLAGLGTGLGLALARRVVVEHRGTIRVENATGGGARFVIDLPCA